MKVIIDFPAVCHTVAVTIRLILICSISFFHNIRKSVFIRIFRIFSMRGIIRSGIRVIGIGSGIEFITIAESVFVPVIISSVIRRVQQLVINFPAVIHAVAVTVRFFRTCPVYCFHNIRQIISVRIFGTIGIRHGIGIIRTASAFVFLKVAKTIFIRVFRCVFLIQRIQFIIYFPAFIHAVGVAIRIVFIGSVHDFHNIRQTVPVRILRIGFGISFLQVIDAIAVAVRLIRMIFIHFFQNIRQSVAIRIFGIFGYGIRVIRIGSFVEFLKVGKSVSVCIFRRIARIKGIQSVIKFPSVIHTVFITIRIIYAGSVIDFHSIRQSVLIRIYGTA